MRASWIFLGLFSLLLLLPAEALAEEVTDVSPPVVIFQMADGRYFHPATGIIGVTEEEVRRLVIGPEADIPTNGTQTIVGDPSITANSSTAFTVDPLVAAIQAARLELQTRIDADREMQSKKKLLTDDDAWREVTLAIWNKDTNELRYLSVEKKNAQLQLSAADRAAFPTLKVQYSNGVNSDYSVDSDHRSVVIAVRYPVLRLMEGKKKTYASEDVVYTPYSRGIHTSSTIELGERYVDALVEGVYERLRSEGVRSRAFPDRLLVDVIDPAMVKAIAAIEHLDESSLEKDTGRALERFFIIMGTNPDVAYNYSRSSAGALGLVQFIPSTYKNLAARSGGMLDADFERAMTSHAMAIRAQVMYLDVLLTEFSDKVRDQFQENPQRINEYIVAAYNGGSGRVKRAMDIWDQVLNGEKSRQLVSLRRQYDVAFDQAEQLRQATLKQKEPKKRAALQKKLDAQRVVYRAIKQQISKLEAAILRPETIGYIEKYRLTKMDERFEHREVGIAATASTIPFISSER